MSIKAMIERLNKNQENPDRWGKLGDKRVNKRLLKLAKKDMEKDLKDSSISYRSEVVKQDGNRCG